ncbi:bacitracin resistance protein [Microbacterium sp. W1N]|uniref:bacitracin resistance protein n=1 Tax=Microbacterium festucae TaxID=2977531 RepID=UPI0021C1881B|nr:bacitracin resistance protein [Microbacterium festucae]MCT9820374.1 bacitracin resistance protein [Microbacterium festucae]
MSSLTPGAPVTPRTPATPRTPVWAVVTIAGTLGLLYAYAVWNAIAFLITQASGALGLNALGWGVLLFAAVLPVIVFGAAFALGWKRSPGRFALLLLAGLGVVAVFWLDVLAYSVVAGASLLGG